MIYSSWDIEQNILKLVILGHFLPFYPLKTPKIKILKNEKICWRYHNFTHVYQKSQSYGVWFLIYGVRLTNFFVILGHFLPFYPSTYPPPYPPSLNDTENKSKFWKEWKKCLKILSFYTYMCTIIEDNMIYGFWNIRCNRKKFSPFWDIFCPFSPLTTWRIKILTLKKTPGDIISHICTIKDNHMMHGSWDMEHDRQFFVILDHFLPFYPPMGIENQNFEKMKKKHLKILSFYKCVP